jgi:hypothetical protein
VKDISKVTFEYEGKVYQSSPEEQVAVCNGCALNSFGFNACAQTPILCGSNNIIWKEVQAEQVAEEELTWTMQEIRNVCTRKCSLQLRHIIESELLAMKKQQDPEYQKYLELKAKFEGGL